MTQTPPQEDMTTWEQHHQMSQAISSKIEALTRSSGALYPFLEPNVILDEYQVVPSGTTLLLDPQIDRPALITSIIASIPSGTAGTLTIGTPGTGGNRRQINLSPGMAPLLGLTMFITAADVFSITITGGTGLISLEIMGGIIRSQELRVI